MLARGVAVQAQLDLAQGNLEAALRWADTTGLHADDTLSFPREMEHLILARVLIARGRGDPSAPFLHDALSLLDRLLPLAEAGARMGSAIEILVLRALALQTHGDTTSALTALERALALAAPEGLRPYLRGRGRADGGAAVGHWAQRFASCKLRDQAAAGLPHR